MLIAAAALTLGATSCSDFLDEENKTGVTAESTYTTATGLEGLVASIYAPARGWYGKEGALGLTEGGTDLFYYGYDNKQKGLNSYNFTAAALASNVQNNPCLDHYWQLYYQAIDICNTALEQASATTISTIEEKTKHRYKGEAYFMRALYYFNMVNTWGAIPYNEESINGSNRIKNPVRKPENEVYGKILADLDNAISEFETADYKTKADGRANYWAARGLKARVLLYAASWLGGQLGQQVADNDNYSSMSTSDLYSAAQNEAEAVINSNYASFYDSYEDVWCMDNEAYKENKESIFGIVYDDDLSSNQANLIPYMYTKSASGSWNQYNSLITRTGYSRGGSAMLLQFVSKWNNNNAKDLGPSGTTTSSVFVRALANAHTIKSAITGENVDVTLAYSAYGRGFCRYVPSLRLWQLLEEHASTDQRTQTTLLDHYDIADSSLRKNQSNYPLLQDTAIYYSILDGNSAEGKALQAWAKNRYRIQFASGGDIPVYSTNNPATALPTEVAKPTSDVYGDSRYNNADIGGWASYPGIKKFLDFFVDKSKASAYYTQWYTYDVSSRDAIVMRLSEMYLIKAEAQLALGNNSGALTTINQLRSARAISGTDNTISSISLDKIMDERAIELCGEQQRWFDLKRTGKLYEYVAKYNAQASPVLNADESKHFLYRPIPQDQIDALTNYTDSIGTEGGFWQNPGY